MKFPPIEINVPVVNVYVQPNAELLAAIQALGVKIDQFEERTTMSLQALKDAVALLKTEVSETKGVSQSAVTLIAGIVQALKDLATSATDLEALRADVVGLAEGLDSDQQALAQAVEEGNAVLNPPTP